MNRTRSSGLAVAIGIGGFRRHIFFRSGTAPKRDDE
jgi:hypothetical protein